jgi:transcriptional regulator, DNA-binding protein
LKKYYKKDKFKLMIRNVIKKERLKRRWTQEKLANRAGVSRQTISRVEDDMFEPLLSTAINIAEALDMSVYEVFELKKKNGGKYERIIR